MRRFNPPNFAFEPSEEDILAAIERLEEQYPTPKPKPKPKPEPEPEPETEPEQKQKQKQKQKQLRALSQITPKDAQT